MFTVFIPAFNFCPGWLVQNYTGIEILYVALTGSVVLHLLIYFLNVQYNVSNSFFSSQERLLYLFLADADRWTECVDWLTDMIDCREEDLKI